MSEGATAAKSKKQQEGAGCRGYALTAEDRAKGGKRKAELARERAKTPRQLLADEALKRIDLIVQVFVEAMEATKPVVSNTGEIVREDPDHPTRNRAAVSFLAEAFGRPNVAITGADGGPLQLAHITLDAAKERLASRVDELAARRHPDVDGTAKPELGTGTEG